MDQLSTKLGLEVPDSIRFVGPPGAAKVVELETVFLRPFDLIPGQVFRRGERTYPLEAQIPAVQVFLVQQIGARRDGPPLQISHEDFELGWIYILESREK